MTFGTGMPVIYKLNVGHFMHPTVATAQLEDLRDYRRRTWITSPVLGITCSWLQPFQPRLFSGFWIRHYRLLRLSIPAVRNVRRICVRQFTASSGKQRGHSKLLSFGDGPHSGSTSGGLRRPGSDKQRRNSTNWLVFGRKRPKDYAKGLQSFPVSPTKQPGSYESCGPGVVNHHRF